MTNNVCLKFLYLLRNGTQLARSWRPECMRWFWKHQPVRSSFTDKHLQRGSQLMENWPWSSASRSLASSLITHYCRMGTVPPKPRHPFQVCQEQTFGDRVCSGLSLTCTRLMETLFVLSCLFKHRRVPNGAIRPCSLANSLIRPIWRMLWWELSQLWYWQRGNLSSCGQWLALAHPQSHAEAVPSVSWGESSTSETFVGFTLMHKENMQLSKLLEMTSTRADRTPDSQAGTVPPTKPGTGKRCLHLAPATRSSGCGIAAFARRPLTLSCGIWLLAKKTWDIWNSVSWETLLMVRVSHGPSLR